MGTQLDKLDAQPARWIEVVEAIHLLCDLVYADNAEVGWWDESERMLGQVRQLGKHVVPNTHLVPTKLALVHSELSEALEAFRKSKMDDHLPQRAGIEVELADACIRIFDLAGYLGLDLGGAIMDKLVYNAQRADHKREARNAPGGKSV